MNNSTESATSNPIPSTIKYILSVNLCLASVVLLQNPVIIIDFYADRKKLSALLFILIAAADMLTAGTDIARGSVALTCIRDNHSKISDLFVLSYSLLSLFSYNCSIFFNLVLTIVKTIHLSNPFYQLQTGAIKTALVVVSLLILIVCIADVFCYWKLFSTPFPDWNPCALQWIYVSSIAFIGEGVLLYIAANVQNYSYYILLCSQYVLPSLVVLVCMCIQVYFIKKMAVLTHDTRDSVHRAHYTVLLVSLSFFVCTCAYTTNVLLVSEYVTKAYVIPLDMVDRFTLPLLNCSIFLLILVIHRSSIGQKNWECLKIVFLSPVLVCRKFLYKDPQGIVQ